MLERDRPIADLRAAHTAAGAGQGSVRLIVGPAGIGKSALLDSLHRIAADEGSIVLRARASELDFGFGFGVVHQLLESTVRTGDDRRRLLTGAAGRAAVLFDPSGPDTVASDPEYGVLSGLYWLIANLAEDRTVVLGIDDLHWADEPSLRFVEYLGRRLGDLPVLIAGTVRNPRGPSPEPGPVLLSAISGGPFTETVQLKALSREAVSLILSRELPADPSTPFLDATWDATAGNPLLVTVVAREAAARGFTGSAAESEGLAAMAAGGVAPAVAGRMRALSGTAVTVARAAAVLGERARREDLVAVAGLSDRRVSEALSRLAEADLVRPDGGWSFRHPLVLAAVTELIPCQERDELHRNAALQLRRRGARPAEIAIHRLATRPAGDPVTVADLRTAATAAVAEGALSTAVELLRRALDEGVGPAGRQTLLFELAELELQTLRPEGPARMQEALDLGLSGEDAARAQAALGRIEMLADPAAGLARVDAARAATNDEGLKLRAEAALFEALVLVDAHSDERHVRYQAIRDGQDPSVVELAHLASEEALSGEIPAEEVADLAVRAARGGLLLREVGPDGVTWNLLTHALRFAERAADAERMLTEGERIIRKRGLRAGGIFLDQSWAYWHRDFGSAAAGLARAQSGYESILDSELPVSVWSLTSVMAENMVLLDRITEADALLDEPLDAVEGTFVEPFALTARGYTRLLNGREDEAEADLRRVIKLLDRNGWHAPAAARGRMRLAELLVRTGRPAEALELTAEDKRRAETAGTPGALGAVLRVQASGQEGEERLATLRGASRSLAASPLIAERSRALLDLGACLRAGGDVGEARSVLRQALDLASRCESTWLLRQVRAEMEASGARPRRERITGLEALTPGERRVAELAAEGMANRQIAETLWVTRKTVEFHLRNVFVKLGIKSRAGLNDVFNGSA